MQLQVEHVLITIIQTADIDKLYIMMSQLEQMNPTTMPWMMAPLKDVLDGTYQTRLYDMARDIESTYTAVVQTLSGLFLGVEVCKWIHQMGLED